MLRQTGTRFGWHYIHPKTGKPLRQVRNFADPRYINNEAALIQGQWGLITADFGLITTNQLENARLAILRRLPRGSFSLVMHSDFMEVPIVKKNPESRYGGGKSPINIFAFKFSTGVPLFEINAIGGIRLENYQAESIFMAGRAFLPIETVVVPQGRVDEYSVFK